MYDVLWHIFVILKTLVDQELRSVQTTHGSTFCFSGMMCFYPRAYTYALPYHIEAVGVTHAPTACIRPTLARDSVAWISRMTRAIKRSFVVGAVGVSVTIMGQVTVPCWYCFGTTFVYICKNVMIVILGYYSWYIYLQTSKGKTSVRSCSNCTHRHAKDNSLSNGQIAKIVNS